MYPGRWIGKVRKKRWIEGERGGGLLVLKASPDRLEHLSI